MGRFTVKVRLEDASVDPRDERWESTWPPTLTDAKLELAPTRLTILLSPSRSFPALLHLLERRTDLYY